MDEISIALDESTNIDLRSVDVGTSDGKIAFSIEGIIRDVDEDVLAAVRGEALRPVEIRFAVADE